jgi:hypothetical protein
MKASRSISVKVKKKSTPGTAGKTKSSTCNTKLFAHSQKKIKFNQKNSVHKRNIFFNSVENMAKKSLEITFENEHIAFFNSVKTSVQQTFWASQLDIKFE